MWNYVNRKQKQRWLWHAINYHSGKILAHVFGAHKDDNILQLKAILYPFGITRFYTDGWGAYERNLKAKQHLVSKHTVDSK